MSAAIMVIDDDAAIRHALAEVLSEEGYDVVVAENGVAALRQLRRAPSNGGLPALILLDLMMPEMDGWTFCVEQRKDPDLARIPVVVMSVHPERPRGTPRIEKPFRIEALLGAVSKYRRRLMPQPTRP